MYLHKTIRTKIDLFIYIFIFKVWLNFPYRYSVLGASQNWVLCSVLDRYLSVGTAVAAVTAQLPLFIV